MVARIPPLIQTKMSMMSCHDFAKWHSLGQISWWVIQSQFKKSLTTYEGTLG